MVLGSLTRTRAAAAALVAQLAKFGVVGCSALIVDVGLFNLLRYGGGHGPLFDYPVTAKVISSVVATAVSWLGNRYWTFRDTRRVHARREFALFVVMCTAGLLISLACLATTHYLLGLTSPLADNLSANVIGLFLGTAFRFWAYRRFVFTEDRSMLDVRDTAAAAPVVAPVADAVAEADDASVGAPAPGLWPAESSPGA
jgi:putative flippase GtrA